MVIHFYPSNKDISVKQYCIESTKFALGKICKEIIDDLTRIYRLLIF